MSATTRRRFLQATVAWTTATVGARSAMASGAGPASGGAAAPRVPGAPPTRYGAPSPFEAAIGRVGFVSMPGAPASGASRTPLEQLEGTITPSALHFERHHSGVPEIDPAAHRLVIRGRVKRALSFRVDDLKRYPLVSRHHFLECSGNSAALVAPVAVDQTCGEIHGLVSGSEWTGIPLRTLLGEAGLASDARWLVCEGADAGRMNRSVPLAKAMDDGMIALYQNGERLRPENGYPLRLFLPGWEGNIHVKWLREITVTSAPAMTREETSKYTDLRPDGIADQFSFAMDVKSVITHPAAGLAMAGPGWYAIKGLAWSGAGAIRGVEVSVDGGRSWRGAQLDGVVLDRFLTRFRFDWEWQGREAVILSRATDSAGRVQPSRSAWLAEHGPSFNYHCNAIQAWRISRSGKVENTYVEA